jgi:hypothetical protein
MKDKYKNEINPGDLVKRCGYVEYADGKRYKISKNTWLISRVEKDKLFFMEGDTEREIMRPADEGDFILVGNAKKGIAKEFTDTAKVLNLGAGTVGEKYRVLKDVSKHNWKKGDIVQIFGKVSFGTLEKGWLEKVDPETKHKHVLVVVDPVALNPKVNK